MRVSLEEKKSAIASIFKNKTERGESSEGGVFDGKHASPCDSICFSE